MKKYILILLFSYILFQAYTQTEGLILFTKQGCSNCRYAKNRLDQNSIYYKEYSLEKNENARLMLDKLAKIKYAGKIYLPVIFFNDTIYHPVLATDSMLMPVSLSEAIDRLMFEKRNGELHKVCDEFVERITVNEPVIDKQDCEIHATPIYLVCQNFKSKAEAMDFCDALNRDGYAGAGVLDYKKYYRVYCANFYDSVQANKELIRTRQLYQMAYLLVPE